MALPKPPLAVDLDGTLIRGDLFGAAMWRLATREPWRLPMLAVWLLRGRAFAKFQLAALYPVVAATLPYDLRVVAWLRAERATGREIALATAFDRAGADAVAAHLNCFDRVFASDGRVNLKSHRKAEALAAAYPEGFVYAGNERADLAVWLAAKAAVVVNASPALEREARLRFSIERVFARE
ncbi:integral membrane protein [alpha proteobacterium U9-1i]|nr:integral membrane protein [alpha proteobacterium U9-1i]